MSTKPQAADESTKVLENVDILEHPPEEDEGPDDETGEDPDNPVTTGEPE